MTTEAIRKTHRNILQHLVSAGKITRQQADTQHQPETMAAIIPDILRVCKDDEAVAAAVHMVSSRPLFTSVEPGIELFQYDTSDNWVIAAGVLYLPNLYDHDSEQQAHQIARREKWQVKRVGVISSSKLEQLRAYNDEAEDNDLNDESLKARAKNRVDDLIREAAKYNASDIHLQPTQGDTIAVRFRIDGELITRKMYKKALHESITRVIIETNANRQYVVGKPIDGKFQFGTGNKKLRIRVSSMPVVIGSDNELKIVMRLLGNNQQLANLDMLGLDSKTFALLRKLAKSPNGLLLYTGPTGSGKTTSQYALMLDLEAQNPNKNFHTIEEPVEFQHENFSHTEVTDTLGTAEALRALLRQDPDVILVGEIRDLETAELAFQAAQTGHFVFASLHANNAHETVSRLSRMNIDLELIVSNAVGVIACRLIRTLCEHCKQQYEFRTDVDRYELYKNHPAFKGKGGETLLFKANPDGCEHCRLTESHHSGGLKGRRSVVEILELTPEVQLSLLLGETPGLLRRRQIAEGTFSDLWDDALRLVVLGVASFTEVETELRDFNQDRVAIAHSSSFHTRPSHQGVHQTHGSETPTRKADGHGPYEKDHTNGTELPHPLVLDNLSTL